jgi:hypothetical protein
VAGAQGDVDSPPGRFLAALGTFEKYAAVVSTTDVNVPAQPAECLGCTGVHSPEHPANTVSVTYTARRNLWQCLRQHSHVCLHGATQERFQTSFRFSSESQPGTDIERPRAFDVGAIKYAAMLNAAPFRSLAIRGRYSELHVEQLETMSISRSDRRYALTERETRHSW